MAVTITNWDITVHFDGHIGMMRVHDNLTGKNSISLGSKRERRNFFTKDYADAAAMTTDMVTKFTGVLSAEMTAQEITDFATELVRVAFAFYVPPQEP